MPTVSLNDEQREIGPSRLSDALAAWEYGERCAVAVNGEFVPREEYSRVELKDGDCIDVVSPVGGG